MAHVDDAELMPEPLATAQVGAGAGWQTVSFDVRFWGDEAVVHDLTTGAIHLLAAPAGRLLQGLAGTAQSGPAAHSAVPSHERQACLHELERIGLIRRETPAV